MAPAASVHTIDRELEYTGPFGRGFEISEGKLRFNGRPFLSDVPPNVVLSPYLSIYLSSPHSHSGCSSLKTHSAFLGFNAPVDASRHVISLGKLKGIRFTSIFRFKLWWTTQWVGDRGSDLETETQMLLLDTHSRAAADGCPGYPYLLILPIFEGKFRASLQAGQDDNVDVCVESGSTSVRQSAFRTCVFLHAGHDPFLLVRDAVRAVQAHLGTFRHLEEKNPPAIVDKFGWCTWDAFYLTVNPEGVWNGVQTLVDGGVPPKFLILDDGWQSIGYDRQDPSEDATDQTVAGDQMWCRLTSIHENSKFRDYAAGTLTKRYRNDLEHKGRLKDYDDLQSSTQGMGAFIHDLKNEFKLLDDIYVWHALAGYWGGVRPGVPDSSNSRLVQPVLAPGMLETMQDLAVEKLVTNTIGLVPPESVHKFYDRYHSYLAKNGIAGVKLDVIHVLEMLGEEYGGRVQLSKAYYDALSASMRKNFGGNRVLASMEHCNDFMLLGTEQISIGRVGDDFWCADASGDPFWLQGVHMVHCAYNSLWMGQFIQPDWDMFQTKHETAAFHAASRAISGGPIYVSDKPAEHDFDLLKKMVLPDGSILRCSSFALPTLDCLFKDPSQDGETVLKIWNLNKCGGVVGVFNCQGGGWSKLHRCTKPAPDCRVACHAIVTPIKDIAWNLSRNNHLSMVSHHQAQTFAVLSHTSGHVTTLTGINESLHVQLQPLEFDIYTIVPITPMSAPGLEFAALGLRNMLNAGGSVEEVVFDSTNDKVHVELRGSGEFAAYTSRAPRLAMLDGAQVPFRFVPREQCTLVHIPWSLPHGASTLTLSF